jgi:hypothetical protein
MEAVEFQRDHEPQEEQIEQPHEDVELTDLTGIGASMNLLKVRRALVHKNQDNPHNGSDRDCL